MSVLAAIAVLGILIIVHELGHFSAARVQGIHVNRFSIGFGPILAKYQGRETEYALRAFPLGGFVGFPDDDPESEIAPDDPNLMRNRPVLDRAIVISAGVIANLIFAYFLLVGQSVIFGIPESLAYKAGVEIPEIITTETSAAAQAGIKSGDVVLAIDFQDLGASEETIYTFQKTIEESPGQPLTLTIQRGQETLDLVVTPERSTQDGKGKIGVKLASNIEIIRRPTSNFIEALNVGWQEYERIASLTAQGLGELVVNFGETAEQVASPVKIVEIGANIARSDSASLFQFGALISINLAIINILPLPALDGGQLAFLLVEGLRGKPLPSRLQESIMQTGLVFLLSLGIFLIIRDTANLAIFQELFQ